MGTNLILPEVKGVGGPRLNARGAWVGSVKLGWFFKSQA